MFRRLVLVAMGLLAAAPGLAADGVREISSACARDGCFPGDAPGFPITITTSGSYLLTSNLRTNSILGQGQDFAFIRITTPDVSLDLGGFAISCSTPSIPSAPCATGPTAGGFGILAVQQNVTLRNGTIRDMADDGVLLGQGAVVEGVRSVGNAGIGISTAGESIVRGCVSLDNGAAGISAAGDSVVVANVSARNADDGFEIGPGSTVRGNTATRNDGDGFDLGPVTGFSSVRGGLASQNTALSNGDFGMRLENVWGYMGNVLNGNNGGNANPQTQSGINLGQNVCGSNTTCP